MVDWATIKRIPPEDLLTLDDRHAHDDGEMDGEQMHDDHDMDMDHDMESETDMDQMEEGGSS